MPAFSLFLSRTARLTASLFVFSFIIGVYSHAAAFADSSAASVVLSRHIDAPEPVVASGGRARVVVTSLGAGESAPKIDGRLDDPCWVHAARVVGFFRQNGALPVVEQTEAWITSDHGHLYVGFHCIDSHPEMIRGRQLQRGGSMADDDYVGIDIDSQGARRGVSTFLMSAAGTQYERIEGGTADNITWTGDWKAAAVRCADGWTGELEIPFNLLRYNRGASTFGVLLFRHVARETSREVWPRIPAEAEGHEPSYMADCTGLTPPSLAPKPVFLPYVLASAAAKPSAGGSAVREGLDFKYPLTTTLTGVGTLYPDFQTIEQSVSNISFSYTEKFVADRRPFFAEGGDYLSSRDLFYSRRIGQIDGGLKVVGKQNDLTIGLLAISNGWKPADQARRQQVYVANISRDLGLYSHVLAAIVEDRQAGISRKENQVGKIEGSWGGIARRGYHPNLFAGYEPSSADGARKGAKEFFHLGAGASRGRPNVSLNFESAADNFVSRLGFNPEINHRGFDTRIDQFNDFDRGTVETYFVGLAASRYRRVRPDTFYHEGYSPHGYIAFRSGWETSIGYNQSRRDAYRDHTTDYDLGWKRRSLYGRGGMHLTTGQVAGHPYQFANLHQGFLLALPLTLQAEQNWSVQGGTFHTQTIATASYRLSEARSVGMRLLRQTGPSDPKSNNYVAPGTNLYFSYGQHVRSGYDLFVLVGDPNSAATKGLVTVKVVQPL